MLYHAYERIRVEVAVHPWLLLAATAAIFASPFGGAAGLAVAVLLIPPLLFMGLSDEAGSAHRRVFVHLGRISFAIYAIHWPVYHLLAALVAHTRWAAAMRGAPLVMACLSGAAVLAIAHLLTSFVDEPVRRWLGPRLFARKPRASAA
jgi:peptidoglycan/LPS O-acetylase OafA/YrhL